jgi:PAS domain S-box-containing protein
MHEGVDSKEAMDARRQLEVAFNQLPAAIYLYDGSGKLLYANELAAKLSSYSSVEELLRIKDFTSSVVSLYSVVDENGKTLEPSEYTVSVARRTKKMAEKVLKFTYLQTGEEKWYLSRCSPQLDEQGEVSLLLTTVTDITIQKKSELVIRENEEKFRMLIEAFPQMAWMADAEGRGIYFNQQYYQYTGLTKEEALRGEAQKIIHPDDWNSTLDTWNSHIRQGAPLELELRYWHAAAQEYVWFLVRAVPVADDHGKILYWVGTSTNIQHLKNTSALLEQQVQDRTRELKLLNEQLAKQTIALQQSNEDLQQFAHVTSHDLKEPVRKIKLFSNMLTQEIALLPPHVSKLVSKIESSALRLDALIGGILAYSSFEGTDIVFSEVDLNVILQNVLTDLEVKTQEKQATIRMEHLHKVKGSPVLIHQLFYNLVNNALKFSKPDVLPVITISSQYIEKMRDEEEADYIEVIVADNGIGFDPAYAESIFTNFVRLNPQHRFEGTGLGLALCKKVVHRHGGKIWAEGVLGQGAKFFTRLPATTGLQKG